MIQAVMLLMCIVVVPGPPCYHRRWYPQVGDDSLVVGSQVASIVGLDIRAMSKKHAIQEYIVELLVFVAGGVCDLLSFWLTEKCVRYDKPLLGRPVSQPGTS